MKFLVPIAFFVLLAVGCTPSVNTLPPDPTRTPTQETSLWLPPNLEIVRLDYDAEVYTRISGGDTWMEGNEGRAFIIAHARHKKTGVHYLLVYEDIIRSSRPSQIIKFEPNEQEF
ncbi:hypothetical protein [Cesiribacter sp. SM1]|uniref:hypothetical protein n=1 Tax=Cesiribacter sp. SM1 TaxID=2861196 RepID=UPI001CD3D924|nr:hypothetical protein [Cesiribacter sp. SM1]